jgi:hypothetical protein
MDATFWLILALFVLFVGPLAAAARASSERRLGRLERKLDLILTHLGLDLNPGVNPEVIELMRSGKKIEAIKLYREQTGVGLKEAKDYVESL